MTTVLRNARFEVVGIDCDLYEGCDFGRVRAQVPSFDIDVRDIEFTDLLSFDAVVHLAALPDEPGHESTRRPLAGVNEEMTARLVDGCKKANVSRFLLASTTDVYGRSGSDSRSENDPAIPVDPASESAVRCERILAAHSDRTFAAIILRSPSPYGVSPRLRLEPLVNAFTASAVVHGRIEVTGDASAWRSLIHVEDLARAYAAILAAEDDDVHHRIINVAPRGEAYRVIDIADAVMEQIPNCTRSAAQHVHGAPSHRVNGSKFAGLFPQFSFRWTLTSGIRQLMHAFGSAGLTPGEYRSDRFRRSLRLEARARKGLMRGCLSRRKPTAA